MNLETFNYTPTEFAGRLTNMSHRSFYYLMKKDIITEEQYNHLVSTVIVSPVPNRKTMGQKICKFFFGQSDNEGRWVFPIVEIPDCTEGEKEEEND